MKILPQLLRVYSREDALQKAETGRADKRLIETALRFYATEDGDIGVTYSGFCIISLPHKALKGPKDRWERRLLQQRVPGQQSSSVSQPPAAQAP